MRWPLIGERSGREHARHLHVARRAALSLRRAGPRAGAIARWRPGGAVHGHRQPRQRAGGARSHRRRRPRRPAVGLGPRVVDRGPAVECALPGAERRRRDAAARPARAASAPWRPWRDAASSRRRRGLPGSRRCPARCADGRSPGAARSPTATATTTCAACESRTARPTSTSTAAGAAPWICAGTPTCASLSLLHPDLSGELVSSGRARGNATRPQLDGRRPRAAPALRQHDRRFAAGRDRPRSHRRTRIARRPARARRSTSALCCWTRHGSSLQGRTGEHELSLDFSSTRDDTRRLPGFDARLAARGEFEVATRRWHGQLEDATLAYPDGRATLLQPAAIEVGPGPAACRAHLPADR